MNQPEAYTAAQAPPPDDWVLQHAELVKRIAYHLVSRMPPSVQVNDLIQAGMVGLLEAANHYDASQGASFETYAGIRVRGAMLDEIRKADWTPRSVYRKVRFAAKAVHDIENRTGRDARDAEVAAELSMSVEEYHQVLQDAAECRLISFDQSDPDRDSPEELPGATVTGPLDSLQKEDFRQSLVHAIEGLPERERVVMALYYDDELNLREIGEVLGISESRVCQIHGQALVRIRARLTDWLAA